ncbi:MAG: trimeric intracellular cation channel family protein, partial [Dehalococcoidia bacterium]
MDGASVEPPLAVGVIAVFVSAIAGAVDAIRSDVDFDISGVIGLAIVGGIGGGLLRDILLQRGTPAALDNPVYLIAALIAVPIALPFTSLLKRFDLIFLSMDAAGLGLWALLGTSMALTDGLHWVSALFVGVVAANGGGLLRDIFSGRVPAMFLPGTFYAMAGAAGCVLFMLLLAADINATAAYGVGAIAIFSIRMLAVRFRWRTASAKMMNRAIEGLGARRLR